jgi:LDH2 family malate/lactate/ureidoglycolate dehydrogenase
MHTENSETPMITAGNLRKLMRDVFSALDVAPDDVEIVVDSLMEATLAGYDAHGVMRVPRYVDEIRQGVIIARGTFTILNESAASVYVDAGRALGPVTATRAIQLACEKAAASGIGCVSTKNSNDIGRLGSYLRQPARRGFLTLLMVNDSGGFPVVAPFGGASRFYSTNPIGAGIPRGDEEPILIDMSTAVTSVGRLRVGAQRGETIPDGWLIDRQGESVVDPARFFDEPENVALLPLGGLLAGHKGFALQLLVDVLAGALGGAGVSTGEDPGLEANALFALAIDPEHFVSRKNFTELVNKMVAGLASVQPLPGVEVVRIPGERAAQERERRLTQGIPLTSATRDALASTLLSLGLLESYRSVLDT